VVLEKSALLSVHSQVTANMFLLHFTTTAHSKKLQFTI
jgi:hypothetical protein